MKIRVAGVLLSVVALVGCTQTKPFTTSESDKFQADEPIATSPSGKSAIGEEAPRFAPGMSRVDPNEIEEDNVQDSIRRLQSDIKRDKAATAKVGR